MTSRRGFRWLIGAACLVLTLTLARAATRLKVTHIPGAPVYKAAKLGQPLTVLPLNTIVDGEVKQGEFWKITVDMNGVKTTGYVHEFLVEEVGESAAPDAAPGPVGSIKTQAELIAEIELKLEENKNLVRQQNDLPQAIDNLRSLIPRVFSLEDPRKQKQVACDIFLWTGLALSKLDDDGGAIKEFRSMFDVDFLTAKSAMEYVSDTYASRLIGTAEKQYNGTFVGYTLQVDTEPKEAVLKIDGQVVGRSPDVITTSKPKVTLEIEKEGYKPEKFVISLKDDKNVKNYVLQSLGRTVRVVSDPPGGAVILDGRDTGKVTDCDLGYVGYGVHRLAIKREGYADWEEEIKVPEGTDPLAKKAVLMAKTYASAHLWGGGETRTFALPTALAVDKAGNYYVVDEGPFTVRKFDRDRRTQSGWGGAGRSFSFLKAPAGIAIDGDGGAYITDTRNGIVARFDKNGQLIRKWGALGNKENLLSRPLGIAVDGNNDVYVVDAGNSRVVKYASVGLPKKIWGKKGSNPGQFDLPTGVAVNSRGEVIVVEAGRVQKFTSDGEFIAAFGKPGSGEGEIKLGLGVCCDKFDNIYVIDGENCRVEKFSPTGRFIGSFGGIGNGVGQMAGPVAIAVDENGSVFVVEKNANRIQTFRPASR